MAEGKTEFERWCDVIAKTPVRTRRTPTETIVYLREVDAGTHCACWVVCAKGDPGAVAFVPR